MGESREEKLNRRLSELTETERRLHAQGYTRIAGIDEAGRGPLAGPVVAACVVFAPNTWVPGVDDSKKLSSKRREQMARAIRERALDIGIGEADVATIAEINILEATRLASMRALGALAIPPNLVVTDALDLPVDMECVPMVGADRKVYCVAAASIIAKVHRDHIMERLDGEYPGYGLAANKGYGTRQHIEAIRRLGPTGIHRARFLRRILADDA